MKKATITALGAFLGIMSGGAATAQQPPDEPATTVPDQMVPQPATPEYAGSVPAAPDLPYGAADDRQAQDPDTYGGTTLIPPHVEETPQATEGGYCYIGAHPVDTRVAPGDAWDPTPGQHMHPYAPIDTRLFAFRDGCYTFTGDPRDFGYAGQAYSYYGAHPVLEAYGGGWCFMMGGHSHLWAPWSPYFTVVGPWYYWHGPYDAFFWAYWPYYSFYYRSYYPHYYGGGRFFRGGQRVAPPIHGVPASAWRGGTNGTARVAPTIRGAAPGQLQRSAPPPSMAAPARPYGAPLAPGPSVAPAARSYSPSLGGPPVRSFAPAPSHGGGFGTRGGFRGGRR